MTPIGNLDSALVANVDPRGRVTPWQGRWSLDWWIGAEDRWHIPTQEVAVRQRLIDAAPVVETAMRIPGGDAVQSAYAIRRSSLDSGGELVIVEVENRSKVPVALAFAVRPESTEGHAPVEHIDLHDESIVSIDGRVALLLPKPPSRSCSSTSEGEDVAEIAKAGEAQEIWSGPVRSTNGFAQAAFVYPLTHGTSVQVALPLEGRPFQPGRSGSRARFRRRQEEPAPTFPQTVPGAEDVARGWATQTRRGMRLELPDGRLAEGVKAGLGSLLLLHDSASITGSAGGGIQQALASRGAASVLQALDLYGFHQEVALAIAASADDLRDDSLAPRRRGDVAPQADAALLWTLAQHWRLTRDPKLVEAMVDAIAQGVARIGRAHARVRRPSVAGRGARDTSAGIGSDVDLWAAAGLRAAAELLWAVGQERAAQDTTRLASVVGVPEDLPSVDTLQANLTLDGDAASREGIGDDDPDPYATVRIAVSELGGGDPRCLERLANLLEAASPTWTWARDVRFPSWGETAGSAYHAMVAAGFLIFVRHLLVREKWETGKEPHAADISRETAAESQGALAMATMVPDTWLGQGWEVHDAPTAFGPLSYAVRWHGERPALLWELQPHPPESRTHEEDGSVPAVRLTAPGLDPAWSSTDIAGEALLAPSPIPSSG